MHWFPASYKFLPLRTPLFVLLTFLLALPAAAQKEDKKLARQIQALVTPFRGEVGVYVEHLNSGRFVALHADTLFPTASLVKIPILIGVMEAIRQGRLQYHQELVYKDSLLYEGADLLGSFKQGEKVELSKLVLLMMSMSDNTASLWLQSLAGGGLRINALLDSLGFTATRVNSRTPGREEARSRMGWGQTTPREMATLLKNIYTCSLLSPAASERMLRSLNRNYWDGESLSQIPPEATLFSKNGAVNASRSEVVLVRGKKSLYLFCIATKNNEDQSWASTNEAWEMTRKLSALLWKYFEPKSRWAPPEGAEIFY